MEPIHDEDGLRMNVWMFGNYHDIRSTKSIFHQLDSNMLSICVRFYYQILQNDFVKKRVVQVPSWKHTPFFFAKKNPKSPHRSYHSLFVVVNISPQVFNHQNHPGPLALGGLQSHLAPSVWFVWSPSEKCRRILGKWKDDLYLLYAVCFCIICIYILVGV